MISVTIVERMMPPMTLRARGARVSAPGPRPKASGTDAATVARVVIRMGRSRIGQAVRTASLSLSPSARSWLV
jgi:hypothetical protein